MASSNKLLLDIRAGIDSTVPGWIKTYIIQRENTEETIKKAAAEFNKNAPCILDFESWTLPKEIDRYIQLVKWFREARPDLRVGYYSHIPNGQGYWPSVQRGQQLADWERANAAMPALVDAVDFVCPSLYSPYVNGDGAYNHEHIWINNFAPAVIEAARKYQKQIYPFVWIRASTPTHNYVVRSKELFTREIQYCLDHADGVCIWDYYALDNSAQAIADTEEVMRSFTVGINKQ